MRYSSSGALRTFVVLAATAVAASPSHGQVADPNAKPLKIEASAGPSWIKGGPLDDSDYADSTELAFTGTWTHVFPKKWKLETSFGPSFTLDEDGDFPDGESSSLKLAVAIETPSRAGFSLVGRAVGSKRFKGRFDDANGQALDLEATAKYHADLFVWHDTDFDAALTIGHKMDSDDLSDRDTGKMTAAFSTDLYRKIRFDVEGRWERRWYDKVDPTRGKSQRREELGISGGFNFAKALTQLVKDDPNNPVVRKLKIALDYYERKSNFSDKDTSQFSPSISIRIGRNF